jgi:hypothetical protein
MISNIGWAIPAFFFNKFIYGKPLRNIRGAE